MNQGARIKGEKGPASQINRNEANGVHATLRKQRCLGDIVKRQEGSPTTSRTANLKALGRRPPRIVSAVTRSAPGGGLTVIRFSPEAYISFSWISTLEDVRPTPHRATSTYSCRCRRKEAIGPHDSSQHASKCRLSCARSALLLMGPVLSCSLVQTAPSCWQSLGHCTCASTAPRRFPSNRLGGQAQEIKPGR